MKTDEDAIVAEIDAFSAAWNKGDAKLTASFFTEDGVRVGAMGDRQQGRVALEAAYDRLLHGPLAGATVRQERGTVRMLTPDLAVWQCGLEIRPKGGAPMPGHVVQVMKKIGGRWLVLEGHPKLFPPSPRT
ncbi:MAG: SgcJ/EcaC family oxidoreductase [Cucumibacter sp.]